MIMHWKHGTDINMHGKHEFEMIMYINMHGKHEFEMIMPIVIKYFNS